ncbi:MULTISPECIES: diguanylate cyclase [Citrobacter]|uniref:diguanylate cyclase n=1 Tax=Citrobacter portucalensis TaxID=1639133 RepID=A0AAJ1N7K0_9ENTR|nr:MULTISPECIES: diguanylate cyclase [Citrobacter]EHA3706523.1 diguanylate cyclase [Citrobacter freundii]MBD0805414.1 diguanylate cyclase [Citrobacter sp. C13]SAE22453.1 diguanylate cyclase [Enterobacter cloacae]EHL81355.1 diguanylate cyclase (GGDEF) domain-containing protein [Citrobacter portucalensis]EJD6665927.1 diguanylate cyclase [Citrobacter freundii]
MMRNTKEIDTILIELNKSIDAHYKWLVKMFRCVVSSDVTQPDIMGENSHFVCRFGLWLNNQSRYNEDDCSYVSKISATHEKMHLLGKELLLAIVEKRSHSWHFDSFQDALLAFTSSVMDYKIYLLSIRSNIDVLTGLPGRRMLDESFDRQLLDAEPLNLYILLLDIDRFKYVNDTYGHLVGDVVLRALASNLLSWTRYDEAAYRYGGEEFIIIIRTKTDEQACLAGLRLCRLIGQKKIPYADGEIGITVTAGITRVQQGETLDTALGRADRAMYQGKQTGRNRCMFMDENERIALVDTNDGTSYPLSA